MMLSAPVLGGIIDRFGFPPMFYTTASAAMLIGILYSAIALRRQRSGALEEDRSAVPVMDLVEEPTDLEETKQEAAEPVAAPFPHLGRSA